MVSSIFFLNFFVLHLQEIFTTVVHQCMSQVMWWGKQNTVIQVAVDFFRRKGMSKAYVRTLQKVKR